MLEYTLLIPLLIIVFAIISRSEAYSKTIKYISYGYFLILSLVFIIIRERIRFKYEHPPISDIYWEKNSVWCEIAMLLYLVPAAIILIFSYIKWIQKEKKLKKEKLLTLPFLILSLLILLAAYIFYFSFILGYRP